MYYTYILTDYSNKFLYVGVTNSLARRIEEHKNHVGNSYTKRYHIFKPVYYECFEDIRNAIAREKQLKRWSRDKKDMLIIQKNPDWLDLTDQIIADQGIY